MMGEKGDGISTGMLYPDNVLEAFRNGCLLDLRVRLAVSFLNTSPLFYGLASGDTKDIAKYALTLAEDLLRQAAERGWLEPLPAPEDTELDAQLRAQAKRTATYQMLQQLEAQKVAAAEQSGIVPVAPRVGPRNIN